MTMQAAAYCRISSDPTGHALGVERQRDDCAALAEAQGWTLARTLIDNDLSAYSGKPRPAYRELLDGIRAGTVEAVVAWHPDRLHRSPAELEEFISLVEAHRVRVDTVQAGEWDLSSPSGRLVARQIGAVSRYESEHKSARVRRALQQRAEQGRSHGRMAYGWTRVHDPDTGHARELVHPAEAEVVRGMADAIIRGESLRSVTNRLNDRQVPSPMGKVWEKGMVRAVVLRDRNAGLRVHHGEVIGEGDWPAILDLGTYEQVRAVLTDPSRRTSTSTAAVHLLSGLARCGICGGPMRSGLNRTTPSYRCAERSCVSRNRANVDDLVQRVILGRLARPDAAHLLAPQRSEGAGRAAKEADDLRARLDLAADDYADGKIELRQLTRITERLRPQIEAATAMARKVDGAPLLDGLVGREDVEQVWRDLPLSRRRAVVDLLVTVRILKGKQGARTFDAEEVSIKWKDEES